MQYQREVLKLATEEQLYYHNKCCFQHERFADVKMRVVIMLLASITVIDRLLPLLSWDLAIII